MEQISLSDKRTDNMHFHFTLDASLESIEKDGLVPRIGKNAMGVEKTEKVFFCEGKEGLLELCNSWIKWMMNNAYSRKDRYGFQSNITLEERKKLISDWDKEFLSKEYLKDTEKKKAIFKLIYDSMKRGAFLALDIEEGKHYLKGDIDENKEQNLKKKEQGDVVGYLYCTETYGTYSSIDSPIMDRWNMHTLTGVGIEPDRIRKLTTSSNSPDMFSVIAEVYETTPTSSELDILPDFVSYGKKRMAEDNLLHSEELATMLAQPTPSEQTKMDTKTFTL